MACLEPLHEVAICLYSRPLSSITPMSQGSNPVSAGLDVDVTHTHTQVGWGGGTGFGHSTRKAMMYGIMTHQCLIKTRGSSPYFAQGMHSSTV